MRPILRVAAMIVAIACAPVPAAAEWLFTPFLGGSFAGGSTYIEDTEQGASASQFFWGGSAAWLTRDRIVGFEGEFSYADRYFERDNRGGLVASSTLSTLTFNVLAAAPLSLTRESLRPYVVGGAGLMHAGIENLAFIPKLDENLLGMSLGGGAIGFIRPDAGLRFDVRHFRTLLGSEPTLSGGERNRLSFWRFYVGVTIRY